MDKHVFISYKHDDSEFAENLIHRVEKEGFTTWLDNESLHPGDDWREGIDQAIRSSFALIVIMSPDAKSSEYVTYEWSFAWGCGIKVIPVMYKKTDLHPRLGSLQYLDFTDKNNDKRPWDRLMKALKTAESKALDASKTLLVAASQPLPSPMPVAPPASKEQKVEEWLEKGELFLGREEYEEALEAFRQAILLDPNKAYAYVNKSEALCSLQKYQEALKASRQAIRLDASLPLAWRWKGDALNGLKRYDEALLAYEEVLRLNPDFVDAWVSKGIALANLARDEEALSIFEKALRLDPDDVVSWINKGNTLARLAIKSNTLARPARYEEALAAYEKALRLDPDDADAWKYRSNALFDLKRYEEAVAAYEQAIQRNPTKFSLWNKKGSALAELGRTEESEQCYQKARELGYKED